MLVLEVAASVEMVVVMWKLRLAVGSVLAVLDRCVATLGGC